MSTKALKIVVLTIPQRPMRSEIVNYINEKVVTRIFQRQHVFLDDLWGS